MDTLQNLDQVLPLSGIILAGGRSRRMGRDKALISLNGKSLIERVMEVVSDLVEETLVVVRERDRGASLPLGESQRLVVDDFPGQGPLAGIFSGLMAGRHNWALAVACDMPFLNQKLLRHMASLRPGVDAVVPVLQGRPQPTHALYSKSCIPQMEERLKADDLKLSDFLDGVKVRYLPEEEILEFDPSGLSFFNVNTLVDLQRAELIVAEGK